MLIYMPIKTGLKAWKKLLLNWKVKRWMRKLNGGKNSSV